MDVYSWRLLRSTVPQFKPKKCTECKKLFPPHSGRQARCDKCRGVTVKNASVLRKPSTPTSHPKPLSNRPVPSRDLSAFESVDRSFPGFASDVQDSEPDEGFDAEYVGESESTSVDSSREDTKIAAPEVKAEAKRNFNAMILGCFQLWGTGLQAAGVPAPPEPLVITNAAIWTEVADKFGLFEAIEDDKWLVLGGACLMTGGTYGPPTYEAYKRVKSGKKRAGDYGSPPGNPIPTPVSDGFSSPVSASSES